MIYHIQNHDEINCYCNNFRTSLNYDVYYNGNEFIVFSFNQCIDSSYDVFIEPITKKLNLDTFDNVFTDRVYYLNEYIKNYLKKVEHTKDKFKCIHYVCKSGNNWGKAVFENVDIQFYLENLCNIDEHVKKIKQEVTDNDSIPYAQKNYLYDKINTLREYNYVIFREDNIIKTTEDLLKIVNRKIRNLKK